MAHGTAIAASRNALHRSIQEKREILRVEGEHYFSTGRDVSDTRRCGC
jgi:hypothetical protein